MNLASFGNTPTKAYNILKKYCPSAKGSKFTKSKKPLKVDSTIINNHQRYFFANLGVVYALVKKFSQKDVAAAAQRIVEEELSALVESALDDTNVDRLCLSGEIFMNIKINKKLRELKKVKDIFVYPNPGEPSAAMGAAYEAGFKLTNHKYYPCDIKLGLNFQIHKSKQL